MVQRCCLAALSTKPSTSSRWFTYIGPGLPRCGRVACLARCNVLIMFIMCRSAQVRERGVGGSDLVGRASLAQPAQVGVNEPTPIWPRPLDCRSLHPMHPGCDTLDGQGMLCDCGNIPTTYKISHRDSTRCTRWSWTGRPQHPASRPTVRLHGEDRPGNAEVTRGRLLVPWFFSYIKGSEELGRST